MTSTGAMILAVFAGIWAEVGVGGLLGRAGVVPLAVQLATRLLPVLLSAALVAAAVRSRRWERPRPKADEDRAGRLMGWASAGEGAAILIAVNVLANTGHAAATVCVIAMIVGLHFVPIARGLDAPVFYRLGAVLVGIGALGLALPPAVRTATVGLGAALTLWVTAARTVRPPRAHQAPSP